MTSLEERFGAFALPVVTDPQLTSLVSLDPARSTMAALFKAAIIAELDTAWQQAIRGLGRGHPLRTSTVVEDVLELEPSPAVMQERKAAWPLLCLHRTGTGTLDEQCINGQVERLIQPWDLHYILGPADTAELRRLSDICIAVVKTVRLCIRRRGHPAYQSGALQFFPALTGTAPDQVVPLFPTSSYIGSVSLNSYDGPGQAAFGGTDTVYYAVTMHLTTSEYTTENVQDAGDDGEMDLAVALANQDEANIDDFVEGVTDPDVDYQYP